MTLLQAMKQHYQWTIDNPNDRSDPNVHELLERLMGDHASEIIRLVEAVIPYNGLTGTPDAERFCAALAPFLAEE